MLLLFLLLLLSLLMAALCCSDSDRRAADSLKYFLLNFPHSISFADTVNKFFLSPPIFFFFAAMPFFFAVLIQLFSLSFSVTPLLNHHTLLVIVVLRAFARKLYALDTQCTTIHTLHTQYPMYGNCIVYFIILLRIKNSIQFTYDNDFVNKYVTTR